MRWKTIDRRRMRRSLPLPRRNKFPWMLGQTVQTMETPRRQSIRSCFSARIKKKTVRRRRDMRRALKMLARLGPSRAVVARTRWWRRRCRRNVRWSYARRRCAPRAWTSTSAKDRRVRVRFGALPRVRGRQPCPRCIRRRRSSRVLASASVVNDRDTKPFMNRRIPPARSSVRRGATEARRRVQNPALIRACACSISKATLRRFNRSKIIVKGTCFV
mmetsp:Transcript_2724/g.8875  ORF Transcript_2724/g.8875 Transcript_2724/m.8875 type:complete len:217 (+) Transcript_2724:433-1083(+)